VSSSSKKPEEVFQKLRTIVCELTGSAEGDVKLESDFIEGLGVDSLDVVEIIMEAEEEFDIRIDDEEAETVKTVQDAVNLVLKKTGP
jgi:acyl carrier protein